MSIEIKPLAIGFILFSFTCSAQVSLSVPKRCLAFTEVYSGLASPVDRFDATYNRPEQIRQELLDAKIVRLIAKRAGLTDAELATVELAPSPDSAGVGLYQLTRPDKAFETMDEYLRAYVRAREEGHTGQFMMAALTNMIPPDSITDLDLGVLWLNRALLPVSWVKKGDSGTRTNKAGQVAQVTRTTKIINGRVETITVTNKPVADQVCRWVTYKVTDGGIQWVYMLDFAPDGRLNFIEESRRDAKEDDPKFEKSIKAAYDEAEAEMRRNGTFGKLGSCHTLWRLVKEKLKSKGIGWRSPRELNPNIIYD